MTTSIEASSPRSPHRSTSGVEATPPRPLAEPVFWELVDQVLKDIGRAPLPAEGPHRDIIRVRPDDRVLQIIAGPGSGKTEMIIWRVLYELLVRNTESRRVMLTTFTKKAATELQLRIVERTDGVLERARGRGIVVADPRVHDLRVGTLHSLCDSLLAEFDLGYMARGTQLIDEMETRVRMNRSYRYTLGSNGNGRVVDRLLAVEALRAVFNAPWGSAAWPSTTAERVDWLLAILGQHTETWIPRCEQTHAPNGIEVVLGPAGLTDDLVTLQGRWETYLDERHVLDFATLQKRFLRGQPSILAHLDHVFVDEFQDTNPIQYAIHLGWLAHAGTRLTVVGDDDQSLYRFRGSDIGCFIGLEADCRSKKTPFRKAVLEENWRSTKRIVEFAEGFRDGSALKAVSLPKHVHAPATADVGVAVRLLQSDWPTLCEVVASELRTVGAGQRPAPGSALAPSAAVLMFSTSEKKRRAGNAPALTLAEALEESGVRVYNPRNKTAGQEGSPVFELLALVSYLIDPVAKESAGAGGRLIEVWASAPEASKAQWAPTMAPEFLMTQDHVQVQKKFRKTFGGLETPGPEIAPALKYIDDMRERLVRATMKHLHDGGPEPRLTLSGLVYRILSLPRYRRVGFSRSLFREALFTQVLESNIAPTRMSKGSLDRPLMPEERDGKVWWSSEVWRFLNILGPLIHGASLDDSEVESFSEHSVSLLTFHQAKGLEFDHVYVALTGGEPDLAPALRTMLFSGEPRSFTCNGGRVSTTDAEVQGLAQADRDREVYVALTRAKQRLTVLHSPWDGHPLASLNPALGGMFEGVVGRPLESWATVMVREHGG